MNTILMNELIEHNGIIYKIDVNWIQVMIVQQSACGDCYAKGTCTVSDKQEKIIEVENSDSSFLVGEKVILFGKQSIGLQAVFLAFVMPFVLIISTLLVLQLIVINESVSGAISILVLVPYYLTLSFFNKKLKSKFKFGIKKVVTG